MFLALFASVCFLSVAPGDALRRVSVERSAAEIPTGKWYVPAAERFRVTHYDNQAYGWGFWSTDEGDTLMLQADGSWERQPVVIVEDACFRWQDESLEVYLTYCWTTEPKVSFVVEQDYSGWLWDMLPADVPNWEWQWHIWGGTQEWSTHSQPGDLPMPTWLDWRIAFEDDGKGQLVAHVSHPSDEGASQRMPLKRADYDKEVCWTGSYLWGVVEESAPEHMQVEFLYWFCKNSWHPVPADHVRIVVKSVPFHQHRVEHRELLWDSHYKENHCVEIDYLVHVW